MSKLQFFSPKEIILSEIKKNGGWVNAHAHIDRAFSLDEKLYKLANAYRHEKWKLNKELRINSTVNDIYNRMAKATELLLSQNVTAIGTFIDIDPDVKDKAIIASQKLREKYKKDMEFKFIIQTSYGIFTKETKKWFDIGSDYVDIIGGLIKAAEGREEEYLDIIMSTAKEKKKMVHEHVDELNTSNEKETELLARKTIQYKMQGKVVGIHGISINAHPKKYREKVYGLMKEARLTMVACPISWINSRRSEELSPIHNPSTPVDEMLRYKIPVAIGVDNISDIFMPYNDGNMWQDLRMLMEMNRLYDIKTVVKIATVNGRRALGLSR